MTHDQLVSKILAAARSRGLLAHYCRDGRRCDGKGFPDLVIAGPGGVAFREVKTGSGELTAEQELWNWTLDKAGADWGVWFPIDWETGTVQRELAALAE